MVSDRGREDDRNWLTIIQGDRKQKYTISYWSHIKTPTVSSRRFLQISYLMYRFPLWYSLQHLTILPAPFLKGHATCVAPLTVYAIPKCCSSNEDNKKNPTNGLGFGSFWTSPYGWSDGSIVRYFPQYQDNMESTYALIVLYVFQFLL